MKRFLSRNPEAFDLAVLSFICVGIFAAWMAMAMPVEPPQRPDPVTITVSSVDAAGELVIETFDAHPSVVADIFETGAGDANFDGVVDLQDLNLVLGRMGTDYTTLIRSGDTP